MTRKTKISYVTCILFLWTMLLKGNISVLRCGIRSSLIGFQVSESHTNPRVVLPLDPPLHPSSKQTTSSNSASSLKGQAAYFRPVGCLPLISCQAQVAEPSASSLCSQEVHLKRDPLAQQSIWPVAPGPAHPASPCLRAVYQPAFRCGSWFPTSRISRAL